MQTSALPSFHRTDGRAAWTQYAVAAVAGSALLALSAHVQVPFWPVRLSMQSFVVLAIGLVCGAQIGIATVVAYLAEGAFGLPVFQSGAGLAYMAGPTGGYLLGFLLAVVAVGRLADRGAARTWPGALAVLFLGVVLIYLPGVAWLALLFGFTKSIAFGLTPFLPAEACKLTLAVFLAPVLQRTFR
jgi:biotin transport system substrate-specific component